jgi:RNA polymerase sigma factor (TIGR02999 family)
MTAGRVPVTELLKKISAGDRDAADRLMTDLYPELHRIAANAFRRERSNHTLQPTALVNEAYMRVLGTASIDWRDRAHFFALMARLFRRILVDHGRTANAAKRGAGAARISLDDVHEPGLATSDDTVAIDEALALLEGDHPRAARVVELKYFGGLSEAEMAEVLGISMPTVARDWRYAKAWLFDRLAPLPE